MKYCLFLLLCLTTLGTVEGQKDKAPKKRKVRSSQKVRPMHRKVVHTEIYEEDISHEEKPVVKKKKGKKAKKILAAIFTFGLSVLMGTCK